MKDKQRDLVIASHNLGKVKEFESYLCGFPVRLLSQPNGLHIDENGSSFMENARIKAIAVANETDAWALADDSGLCVNSLGGAPGIYSSRYAKNDKDRINRLLSELVPFDDRTAYFSSALCLASPGAKILIESEGRCEGLITHFPRGEGGFGYDPVFEVYGTGLTFAEMSRTEKQFLGHRGIAFSLLEPGLNKLFKVD